MNLELHDLIGFAGVLLIAGCYALHQLEKIDSSRMAYSVGNAAGATMILISLGVEFNPSAFLMEAFWLAMSLYGVAKCWRRRS